MDKDMKKRIDRVLNERKGNKDLEKVKKKMDGFKKKQDLEYKERIVKLLVKQKKRESALKKLSIEKRYRSVSAKKNNNRDMDDLDPDYKVSF